MTSPSLVLQHSTAWLPAPIPSTGTPYHKLCPPKSHKPLLMPASHPETPPGHSSTDNHSPSLLLLVAPQLSASLSAPAYEPHSPPIQHLTQGPGVLCRLGTAIQSILATAGGCQSCCQVLALATRMNIAPLRGGLPLEIGTECPTRRKWFCQNAAFVLLKQGRGIH